MCCSVQFPGIRGSTPAFGNLWWLCVIAFLPSVYWSYSPLQLLPCPPYSLLYPPNSRLFSPAPRFNSVCFPQIRESSLSCRVVDLPGVTSLTAVPSQGSYQTPAAPQLGWDFLLISPASCWDFFFLSEACADLMHKSQSLWIHPCKCLVWLCLENIFSLKLSTTSVSLNLSK